MSKTCLWHDDILAPQGPFAPRQFQHLHLVQGRNCLEVEAVQTLDGGEFGGFDPVARQGIAQQWPERGRSIMRRSRSRADARKS